MSFFRLSRAMLLLEQQVVVSEHRVQQVCGRGCGRGALVQPAG
jgi:hypothetical protein